MKSSGNKKINTYFDIAFNLQKEANIALLNANNLQKQADTALKKARKMQERHDIKQLIEEINPKKKIKKISLPLSEPKPKRIQLFSGVIIYKETSNINSDKVPALFELDTKRINEELVLEVGCSYYDQRYFLVLGFKGSYLKWKQYVSSVSVKVLAAPDINTKKRQYSDIDQIKNSELDLRYIINPTDSTTWQGGGIFEDGQHQWNKFGLGVVNPSIALPIDVQISEYLFIIPSIQYN
tara:strand:+ start:709 stop:1422 length:714 start_codon:yes stop_codon:yes gene_type:complete